ncbi:MAG: DNA adenine methylase [Acidobacteriota bacterium]|jgi:DNA adenine methylase|nr:DNA adenine methylase [Acidobacteriota bacterium]
MNELLTKKAKPFLKWAGGKTQLLSEIEQALPCEIYKDKFSYVEPFIGSGAVLFWMLNNFPNLEKAIINDVNSDLTNTYKIIKSKPEPLIGILKEYQSEYHDLQNNEAEKKAYYYVKRELYNTRESEDSVRAALFIFLNRTCFNGLYRVNSKNLFNVPIGSYKRPMICDEQNILAVNNVLQNVEILNGDFKKTITYASKNSFFYLDPPYKPLNSTSSFNSYAKGDFNDEEQIRLRDFCVKLDEKGSKWMLSNSDVQDDNFFDKIYSKFTINKVNAVRAFSV